MNESLKPYFKSSLSLSLSLALALSLYFRSSMRRVTAVMNKIDSRKHDKFSNQFNYALKWHTVPSRQSQPRSVFFILFNATDSQMNMNLAMISGQLIWKEFVPGSPIQAPHVVFENMCCSKNIHIYPCFCHFLFKLHIMGLVDQLGLKWYNWFLRYMNKLSLECTGTFSRTSGDLQNNTVLCQLVVTAARLFMHV